MNKSRRMRWEGHVAHMEKEKTYMVLVGEPEEKIPLSRPRRRWENNIKMDPTEIRWTCMGWSTQSVLPAPAA
jgi:hypothetical protein